MLSERACLPPGLQAPKAETRAYTSLPRSSPRAWHTVGALGDYHELSTWTTLKELAWTQLVFLKAWDGIVRGPQDDLWRTQTQHEITVEELLQFSFGPVDNIQEKVSIQCQSILNTSQHLVITPFNKKESSLRA